MDLNIVNNSVLIYSIIILGGFANFVSLPENVLNFIKKIFGIVWIMTSLFATYALFSEGFKKMNAPSATLQTSIQWWIILIIFSIVMIGFFIHGYYCLRGEYNTNERYK